MYSKFATITYVCISTIYYVCLLVNKFDEGKYPDYKLYKEKELIEHSQCVRKKVTPSSCHFYLRNEGSFSLV